MLILAGLFFCWLIWPSVPAERTSTKRGGDAASANIRQSDYTANLLNHYEQRTVLGYLDILGIAASGASVQVNSSSSGVERKGQYFRKELTVSNTSAAQYPGISVQAINGTNASPIESGNFFIQAATEVFTYDADGNLISDGRWDYTWDAENQLIKLETFSGAPSTSKRRLEFKYDGFGHRTYKKETDLSTSTVIAESTFLYDDWNLYAEVTPGGTLIQSYTWCTDLSGTLQDAGGVGGLLGV